MNIQQEPNGRREIYEVTGCLDMTSSSICGEIRKQTGDLIQYVHVGGIDADQIKDICNSKSALLINFPRAMFHLLKNIISNDEIIIDGEYLTPITERIYFT